MNRTDLPSGPNDAARQAFLQARCGSVGASDVPNIIRRTKTGYGASRANLMALKAVERLTGVPAETYQSAAMAVGLEREPLARAAYAFLHDVEVELTDPIRHPLIKGSHASPDGLIGLQRLALSRSSAPNWRGAPRHAVERDDRRGLSHPNPVATRFDSAVSGRITCRSTQTSPSGCNSGRRELSATRSASRCLRARGAQVHRRTSRTN